MIIASIDIGSNTILLLIANYDKATWELFPITNEYNVPRISKNLEAGEIITDDSLKRLFKGLDHFNKIITKYNPEIVLVNATNAMRVAKNAQLIKKLIEKKYNWNVNIITGEREAELTFLGIALPSLFRDENVLLIDIGGGSTEISYGNISKYIFKQSFQLGIVTLFDRYVHSDPPSTDELNEIRLEISQTFLVLRDVIPHNPKAVAVAGTPTTLSSILLKVNSYEDELIENSELTKEYLTDFIDSTRILKSSEIKSKYGSLVEGREDLILIGTIILEELMNIMRIEKIIVSTKGLRYGAIWDYLISQKLFVIPARNENPSKG